MNLIIGLGNPDNKYQDTRHNVGFLVVDKLLEEKADDFDEMKLKKKFKAEVTKGKILQEEIVIAKPQTYMNKSGDAVKSLVKFYKVDLHNLIVVHDDVDLPVGKIRISQSASSAGQKGVQDIIDKLKSNEFIRLRIGIGSNNQGRNPTEKYVLQKFTSEQKKILDEKMGLIMEALDIIITQGPTQAMNLFN
ncbi:aminoacyl-tRNA hydrolase [Patescibacteria group bacterium]|nr:aminoacyl-tRNA hydrolase [Patescibacteria group bacterium]